MGNSTRRDTFINRLVNELANASSYHFRLLFEVCIVLRNEMVKTDVFERLCRSALTKLKDDPVSNVRAAYNKAISDGSL